LLTCAWLEGGHTHQKLGDGNGCLVETCRRLPPGPLVVRDLPVLREVFGLTARFAANPQSFATELDAALSHPDPHQQAACSPHAHLGRGQAARCDDD
jgi:hypothetical protein